MAKLKSLYIFLFLMQSFGFFSQLKAQNHELVLHRLTVNDGLSNRNILQIFQDSKGFIWLCTEDGLNLFDGYTFKTYKHNAADSTSISNNNVISIIENKKGEIWVGTNNGLNVFDPTTQTFKKYFLQKGRSNSISSDRIMKFCLDKQDNLWIGTDNGLNRYNPRTNDFTRFNVVEDLSQNVKGNSVTDLVCDKTGMIWSSEYFRGMYRIDPNTGSIKNYPINGTVGPLKNIVLSICPNPNGNLWLGLVNGQIIDFNPYIENFDYQFSEKILGDADVPVQGIVQSYNHLWYLNGKALVKYNIKNKTFEKYFNDPLNPESLPKGTPNSIAQTSDGNIWIGLEGIVMFSPNGEKFSRYYHKLPKESSKIQQNYVTTFHLDKHNNLFIGTFLDGLIEMNLKTGLFKRLNSPSVFNNSAILDIKENQDGKFWIATSKGLVLFNSNLNKIEELYVHKENDQNSIYHDLVELVCPDKNNKLWLATQESLDEFDIEKKAFRHYTRENLKGLSHYKITSILSDKAGNIWVGTFNGLNKIDHETHEITKYLPSSTKKNQISDSYINNNGIFEDKSGSIWISTKNGLNKFDSKTNSFSSYFQSDGLLSDNVYGINEDDSGNLWVTSDMGMSKFNIKKNTFQNYNSLDGLDISIASLIKDNAGFFYIGGRHENFYRFHPDSIHDNLTAPKVYLTELLLFNKPVGIFPTDNTSPLKESLLATKEIILNYKQSDFALEFTALNYNISKKNRFAYKLEGFNDDWIYTDAKRRIAGYTNLDHGNYVFKVKASNNDGIWDETGASVKIKILPPPWKTKLAYFIYILIIATILYFIRSVMLRQLYLKNSLRLEHLELEKEREFDAIKTKFFTNISHEFRTPLTLISGPINKLIAKAKENKTEESELKYLHLIEQNTKRLAQLTNQLLDFRKIETGTMKLEVYHGDIVKFIKDITDRFRQFAQSKNILLEFSALKDSVDAWFDPDKLDKILSNLLSNALKFTTENGKVSIHISLNLTNPNYILITVEDNGIGITPEELNHIFNRFYQVSNSNTSIFEGSGIGLALAKDMAQLCNGDITAESAVGKGSNFVVKLPIDLAKFENYTILSELKKEIPVAEIDSNSEPINQLVTNELMPISSEDKPQVLIIEDNKDMRFYISDILLPAFKIEEAENGIIGLEKAFRIIPDIIICDVMMPEKDGFDVSNILKSDKRTSHIPIILLTALNSIENKLKGLETGAVDYITKPFNPDILLLKIKNSIATRQKAKEFFIQSLEQKVNSKFQVNDLQPKEVTVNSIDEKILFQALEIVEKNISDPEFNVDKFATEIGMEASTLYKKLMALIDMPPGEFIRDIRMKRAVQLLDQNKVSISDIAYMVGFDSPNYFSKVFKKYYNISPTDYMVKKRNKDSEN